MHETVNPAMLRWRIFFSVGDASADLYASLLIPHLKRLHPHVELWGIGGPRMRTAGVRLLSETTRWSAIGLFAAARCAIRVWSIYRRVQHWLKCERPDTFVALDFGAVNRRLTLFAVELGIPTVYYVTPGFWTKNITAVQRYLHPRLLYVPIFPWQREILLKAGATPEQVYYFGHPLIHALPLELTRREAEERLGLPHKDDSMPPFRIALLPGSRKGEVSDNLPLMVAIVQHAVHIIGDAPIQLLCARAPTVSESLIQRLLVRCIGKRMWQTFVWSGKTHEVLKAADVALVVTGTATLEAACLGVPAIALFNTNWLNRLHAIIIHRKSLPFHEWGFTALPNRLLGYEAMPEFILWRCDPKRIAPTLARWLTNPHERAIVAKKLRAVVEVLGTTDVSEHVAHLIWRCWRGS